MKKTGLCIVYQNMNYGSILQSYATLLELKALGVEYEIIRYDRKRSLTYCIGSLPRLFIRDMAYSKMRKLRKIVGQKLHREYAINNKLREKKFKQFVHDSFDNFSEPIYDFATLKRCSTKYGSVLVGSDQLWLPSSLATEFYTLMFAEPTVKRIAYAASFGVSSIPFYQKKRTKEYLDRIDSISVREQSGQKIISELTGREAKVLIDPTLVISKDVWDQNISDEKVMDQKYIFCYFLGKNPEHREQAKKLGEMTGMKIVTVRHLDEYIQSDETFGDYAPYDVGPAEFVNLIRHASYICTDSYHGTVFSIMNHKQFIVFNRYPIHSKNSRNSRLDSLFNQLGISRWFEKDIVREMNESIDYQSVEQKLMQLRQDAEKFLKEALNR